MANDVLKLLKNHTSMRDYKPIPIDNDELKQLIYTAQHASSSNFVQAYSVIQITDTEKIKKLASLANNQRQILSAPVVLLFCADYSRLQYACFKHGVTISNHNLENLLVTTIDTALFAQNFAIASESQGYGVCFIGGVRYNPDKISKLVDLPQQVFPLFGMTVGVPAIKHQVKPRLPVESILHENSYQGRKYDELLNTYDQVMEKCYKERATNQTETNWSKKMAVLLNQPIHEHMQDFIRSRGFDI